jgi:tetratricopeptide (TPR) repeat protein
MKKLTILCLLFCATCSYAQVDLAPGFRLLYEQSQYDRLTSYVAGDKEIMSAKAFYYVAMAHFMKQQDEQAIRLLDSALAKGPADGDMYYYKGVLLLYNNRASESLPFFKAAIALQPGVADFWSGKGDAFDALKQKDSALVYFEKACTLEDCKARVFLATGNIHSDENRPADALPYYRKARELMPATDANFITVLYNLGLTAIILEEYAEARKQFEEMVRLQPDDYRAVAKLIQACFGQLDTTRARALKEQMYAAYKNKKLPNEFSDRFCFAQFPWNGRRVMAYEKFDEGTGFIRVKYQFMVLDSAGRFDYRIDAESSNATTMAGSKFKYVLCLVQEGSYRTFWNFRFNDDFVWPELKEALLAILHGKVQPQSSTTRGGK